MSSMHATGSRCRVLFVHEGAEWIRGSERCLLDLVGALDRQRFEPLVWCNAGTLQAAARDQGVDALLMRTPPGDWRRSLIAPSTLREQAARIFASRTPNIVHCNGIHGVKWVLPAARGHRVPVLAHLHLPTTLTERRWEWLHQVDLAVGVSAHAAEGLVEDGMPRERVRVILNAIDPRRLCKGGSGDPPAVHSRDGLVRLVSVGSLVHRKGYDVVLRAFARALREAPFLRLRLAGAGPEETALRELAATLSLDGRVEFTGETGDLAAFYEAGADIFISASRLEAFNLTIAEAALLGLPVIASDIPPHREVLGADSAEFATAEDVEETAAAIVRLACSPALRERNGRALQARARRLFSLNRYAAEFTEAYEWLAQQPARAYSWPGAFRWPRTYTAWIRDSLARRLHKSPG